MILCRICERNKLAKRGGMNLNCPFCWRMRKALAELQFLFKTMTAKERIKALEVINE